MESPRIVLAAEIPGHGTRTWSSSTLFQIGRLPDLEVTLDHVSVSRRHAELALTDDGWVVRDLGSSNGTFLNGVRLGRTNQRVRQGDVLKIGDMFLRVEQIWGPSAEIQVGSRLIQVEATTRRTWDEAMDGVGSGARQTPDTATLLRLIRSGYRLSHAGSVKAELQQVLDEAIAFFGAQRGGILFTSEPSGALELQCVSVSPDPPTPPRRVNKIAAARAFAGKESFLFQDPLKFPELAAADSIARGVMASIICAIIRSPDKAFGVLHLDRGPHQEPFTEADLYLADSLAAALAIGVERIQLVERHQDLLVQTVTALAQAVEMRDPYTGDHTSRVTTYSLLLAEAIELPDDQRQLLRTAAALHDIGKIAIDDQILRKPGRLSEEEFDLMKTHVTRGVQIIETMPGLAWALPVVRSHHERWDGRGYPDGLKEEQIPLTARVVAVADAFDAMTSDRPYRRGMKADAAFDEIRAGAGKQFDPRCAEAFHRIRAKVEFLLEQERDFRRQAEKATDTISVRELRHQMVEDTARPVGQTPLPPDKKLGIPERVDSLA